MKHILKRKKFNPETFFGKKGWSIDEQVSKRKSTVLNTELITIKSYLTTSFKKLDTSDTLSLELQKYKDAIEDIRKIISNL